MYIVISFGRDKNQTTYYYGVFRSNEEARRWAEGYHGTTGRYVIQEVERVA